MSSSTSVSPLFPVDCEKAVVGVEYVVEGGAVDEGELVAEPVLLLGALEDIPRFDSRRGLKLQNTTRR